VSSRGYLLDTHVLLWSLNGDPRLSSGHFDIIEAGENLTVSVARYGKSQSSGRLENCGR